MDRNVEKAFGLSLSVITYTLFGAIISFLFITAYRYLDFKVSNEKMNMSLIRSQDSYLQEDEDITLYTGRTVYNSTFGDSVNIRLSGDSTVSIAKNDASDVTKSGEAVTGAAVFYEIMSLPQSIDTVIINGNTLKNRPDALDSRVINGRPNIAYYVKRGMTEELLADADINLTDYYRKSYKCDAKYGYVTAVIYTGTTIHIGK